MSLLSELKRRNVIRVGVAYLASSWLFIQVVETLVPVFELPNQLIRLVVIVLMIGFPIALVVSWFYSLTPETESRNGNTGERSSTASHANIKFDRAIIAVLAVAAVYFAVDKFLLSDLRMQEIAASAREEGRSEALSSAYGNKSIAVLPFLDMSPDGDHEYLSDGIAEELLNILAKVPELRVISRTSAFSYKNKEIRVPDVATELNVGHILEGSVRKSGSRLRITVQLIEAQTDTHLWSETYDREMGNIFAVQDDIAIKVVEKLKLTLLDTLEKNRSVDPAAYVLFLQANHMRAQSTPEGFATAVQLYQEGLEIDPDYAAAWEYLGLLYCMQANFGLRPLEEGYALCRESTEKALEIDPDYAPAHSALGWIAMMHDYDIVAAAKHYEKALALAPTNISIIGDTAVLVQYLNRLDEAIALTEYALARDPVNPVGFANMGLRYRYAGRLDEAIEAFRTAKSLSPDRIGGSYQLGITLLRLGDAQAALEEFEQEPSDDWRVMGIALAAHALGRQQAFETAISELIDGWGNQWPTEVAQVYAWIGDNDKAFEWLQKSLDLHGDNTWPDIRIDDLMVPLHPDPRWPRFADALGISAAELAVVDFSFTLPEQSAN